MTSEARNVSAPRKERALAPDLVLAWLEGLELPSALCDDRGHLLATTGSFEALCGGAVRPGIALRELFGDALPLPKENGDTESHEVDIAGGRLQLRLRQRNGVITVVARAIDARPEPAAAALLELSRSMLSVTSEEMLVAAVSRGMKRLFPGARYCVRLTDPETLELSSVYSEGRLKPDVREVLVLKRSALEKSGLTVPLDPERVPVVDSPLPTLFEGTHSPLSAPLVANGQLFGALRVESPAGRGVDLEAEHALLLQLANQVAVAVRNVKLIEELTLTRNYLAELLEGANALIVVTDRQLRAVRFNRAMREISGKSPDAVLGTPVLELLPRSRREAMRELLLRVLEKGEPEHLQLEVIDAKREPVRLNLALSPVRNAQGEVDGVIAIGHDLTHLHRLELRALQNEKLAGLGQLAASVAHEINNPMTAVATYASALYERIRALGASADAEKLKRILEASDRILRFTRDLTTYSRPGSGSDAPVPADLGEILGTSVRFCEHVAAEAKVELDLVVPGPLPILAERVRLGQVFVNLVTNACHATAPGGRIVVRARIEGEEAVVEVEDSGAGIPREALGRIFEPFFTTKARGEGTGLGLSIVREIVEKHHGRITVESTEGQGTTFTVRLPRRGA